MGGRNPQAPLEPPLFTVQIVAQSYDEYIEKNNLNEKSVQRDANTARWL